MTGERRGRREKIGVTGKDSKLTGRAGFACTRLASFFVGGCIAVLLALFVGGCPRCAASSLCGRLPPRPNAGRAISRLRLWAQQSFASRGSLPKRSLKAANVPRGRLPPRPNAGRAISILRLWAKQTFASRGSLPQHTFQMPLSTYLTVTPDPCICLTRLDRVSINTEGMGPRSGRG